MQAKAWLFEAAMEADDLETARLGFIGIRKKTQEGTRTYLEATALLAICYLRKNRLDLAEPLIAETLKRERNIGSEARRRRFIRNVVKLSAGTSFSYHLDDFTHKCLIRIRLCIIIPAVLHADPCRTPVAHGTGRAKAGNMKDGQRKQRFFIGRNSEIVIEKR